MLIDASQEEKSLEAFVDTIAGILAARLRQSASDAPGRRRGIRANLELLEALNSVP
jgi:hypothetical protein